MKKIEKNKKFKNCLLYCLLAGFSLFVFLFLLTTTRIGINVDEYCKLAQDRYEGDCVEALIQVVDNENNPFSERNTAIWTLGQLGDERAKGVLEKYYTGEIPDKEPYSEVLSQYEMKKALNLVNGGLNITHFVWKN